MAASLAQVLYVEDQRAVGRLLQHELERAHIGITSVPTGEEGLLLARATRFDLILLDAMLPDMDGLEVCRRLKSDAALQDIPIIFFTAYPSQHHQDKARRLGAVDYLIKGFPEARLATRILAEVALARDRTTRRSKKGTPSIQPGAQPPPGKS